MHKQVEKNHHFKQSMKHAVNGIQTVFQDERNFRFDVVAAIVVVILGFLLKIERLEWYWIVFCIFLAGVVLMGAIFVLIMASGIFIPKILQIFL